MDREKVIKGLEILMNGCEYIHCDDCCFYISTKPTRCGLREEQIQEDALALLKEQEAEAKWIYGEDKTGVDGWYCSECNFFEPWFYEFTEDIDFIRFYGHCPKCGRRMTSYTGKPTQEGR